MKGQCPRPLDEGDAANLSLELLPLARAAAILRVALERVKVTSLCHYRILAKEKTAGLFFPALQCMHYRAK